MKQDGIDREKIREKLKLCIDLLGTSGHPKELINIVTGSIGSEAINVDNSYSLGEKQMREYEASWPDGFNSTISRSVITLKE